MPLRRDLISSADTILDMTRCCNGMLHNIKHIQVSCISRVAQFAKLHDAMMEAHAPSKNFLSACLTIDHVLFE